MSKVGKFLIARPNIDSSFFKKSVVFIYEESNLGTLGLNLSTQTNLTLKSIDPDKEVDYFQEDPVIYLGGPVNNRAVMMLHSEEFITSNTLVTGTGLNVSSDNIMVDKMFSGNWPEVFRLTVGASVWGPKQLDFEISQNYWLVSELDHLALFDLWGDELWNWAIEHVGSRTMSRYF